jgi:hypothetical protein
MVKDMLRLAGVPAVAPCALLHCRCGCPFASARGARGRTVRIWAGLDIIGII